MGGGVNLKVPGVDHHAHGTLHREADRVGNGVVGVDELHGELARLDDVPCLAGDQLSGIQELVLLQLQAHQAQGHPGRVDGGVEGPQHVGQGANVVLMPVGEKDPPDLVLVLDQIAHVRDDHVHAIHIIVGKAHAHVHDDNIVAILIDGEVFADLIESAQGNDFQFFCHNNSFFLKKIPQRQTPKRDRKKRKLPGIPVRPVPRRVMSVFPVLKHRSVVCAVDFYLMPHRGRFPVKKQMRKENSGPLFSLCYW